MKTTLIYLVAYAGLLVVSGVVLLPDLFIGWVVIAAMGLLALVRWHSRAFAYRCANCGSEFQISALTELFGLQGFSTSRGWKYLRCPFCNERTRATVVERPATHA